MSTEIKQKAKFAWNVVLITALLFLVMNLFLDLNGQLFGMDKGLTFMIFHGVGLTGFIFCIWLFVVEKRYKYKIFCVIPIALFFLAGTIPGLVQRF